MKAPGLMSLDKPAAVVLFVEYGRVPSDLRGLAIGANFDLLALYDAALKFGSFQSGFPAYENLLVNVFCD